MPSKPSSFRYLALAATISVLLLIVIGGMLSASGSGGACLDWPACFGRWTPPPANATLDYLHRLWTVGVVAFVTVAAWVAWRRQRRQPWIIRSIALALVALAAQIALGAWMALAPVDGIGAWLSSVHMGLSLLVLAALLVSTVVAFYSGSWATIAPLHPADPDRPTTQRSIHSTTQL